MYKYVRLVRETKSKIEKEGWWGVGREKVTGTFGNNPTTDAFTPHSMLYQTPHPLPFQFHPLPSSSSSPSSSYSTLLRLATTPSSLLLSLYPSPLEGGETEMECVEAALKTSFRKDMAMKFSPQAFIEELSAFNVQNGAPCDDLFVDELLDFSHVEQQEEEQQQPQEQQEQEEEQQQHKEGDSACVSPHQTHEICNPATTHYYANDDFASVPTSVLSVPDDVADLEWLSHFVEDSFLEFSAPIPTVTTTSDNPKQPAPEKTDPLSPVPTTQLCFKTPVPAKARSKRTRTGVRVWPLGSPSFATDSSSSSTTTTTSSSSSSSPSSPLLIYATNLTQSLDQVYSEAPAPAKKPKKKPSYDGAAVQAPRRCSHCGVQKTPQWRTGPLGAKTLCNACGVRYKSGRLLPEYRPACCPTFSSELHSNHHRKVLEMRRKKEMTGGVETGFAPPPVVPSF